MIPAGLEKLVFSGKAKVGSATLGLSALSSFQLPDKKNCIIYSLGIHPFVDAKKTFFNELGADSSPVNLLGHTAHVYEFADGYSRFSVADRSSFSCEPGNHGTQFNSGKGQRLIPQHGQTIYPVYWRFNAKNVVLRIFTIPSASKGAVVNLDIPPQIESATPGGYGAIPFVVGSMESYGGVGNTNYWQPDLRVPAAIPVQERVNNARGIPTTANTEPAIIPYDEGGISSLAYSVYTMPLVNVNYVYFDETLTLVDL
jgi:hypothetical protein